ncbi:MAG: hypothetical protein ABIM74_00685 [candidate division WOR-3 bacterium]
MYCEISDVRAELGLLGEQDRTDEEISLAICQASDIIDAFTGRHFRAEPASERHNPIRFWVLLSHWPVHSVVSVKDDKGNDVAWEWLNQRIGEMRVETGRPVDVVYYYNDPKDPVPDDVARTVARVAARILAGPRPDISGFRSGETGIDFRENPLLSDDVRWVLIRYAHRRRFL